MWKNILTAVILMLLPFTSGAQELGKYLPLEVGMCEDVKLQCIKAILKTTDIYYVLIKNGKPIAITKVSADGREEVIWGDIKLPLKKGEHSI